MSPSYDPDPFRYLRDQAYGRITIGGRSGDPAWSLNSDFWWNAQTLEGNMPLPTDTHAQSIYAPNAAGVYTSFGANVLTRTDLGLQTVPTRTNGVSNSNAQGAVVAGSAPTNWQGTGSLGNGVSVAVVGLGTEDGLQYIDLQFTGTVNGGQAQYAFESTSQVAATGEAWTLSCFMQLIGGSLANVSSPRLVVNELTSANAYVTEQASNITLDSTKRRHEARVTLAGGGTVAREIPYFKFNLAAGSVPIDFTVRVKCPQAERNAAFASAPIVTTGSTATVNGNQQVISGLGTQLVTGVAGLVQFNQIALQSPGNKKILTFSDGTGSNLLTMASSSGTMIIQTASGGVFDGNVSGGAEAVGLQTWAFAYAANYLNFRKVGASANTADTSLTMPVGLDRLGIGGLGFSSGENTYQFTIKLALDFLTPSDDPATKFAEWYAKAQLAAAA